MTFQVTEVLAFGEFKLEVQQETERMTFYQSRRQLRNREALATALI